VLEGEPEHNSSDITDDSWTTKHPSQIRIVDQSRKRETKSISNTLGQKVEGRDQSTHVDGRAGVGDSVGGHVDEEFGEATNGVGNGDEPDGDGREETDSVFVRAIGGSHVSAGRGLVGVVVEDGVCSSTDSSQEQSGGDTCDRTISDAPLAEHWVERIVQDRSSDNDQDGVEVLEEIVGHAVAGEHGVDSVSGGSETIVVDGLDGEETEHSAGLECSTDILDEVVVPWDDLAASAGGDDTGFGGIPESVAADSLPSFAQAHTDDFAASSKIASSGWVKNETGLDPEENGWKEDPNGQWQSKGKTPSNVLLSVGSWNTHEGTDVDETVEPKNGRFSGSISVDDHPLSGFLSSYNWLRGSHLIEIQWGHTRFEHGWPHS